MILALFLKTFSFLFLSQEWSQSQSPSNEMVSVVERDGWSLVQTDNYESENTVETTEVSEYEMQQIEDQYSDPSSSPSLET